MVIIISQSPTNILFCQINKDVQFTIMYDKKVSKSSHLRIPNQFLFFCEKCDNYLSINLLIINLIISACVVGQPVNMFYSMVSAHI